MSARRPDSAASPARGALLVAVAVVLGLILVRNGLDTSATVSAGSRDRDRSTTTTASSTSSTTAERPASQVNVLVANGSGVDGAALRLSNTIKGKGYNSIEPTNARANVTTTQIFYVAGYQREAQKVASAIGAAASTVAAMPTPAPVANLGGAHVLVVLGPDLATEG